jgi:hypothetical protein
MFGLLTQDEIMNFIKGGGPDGRVPDIMTFADESAEFTFCRCRNELSCNFDA